MLIHQPTGAVPNDQLTQLEQEIVRLEKELHLVEQQLNSFTSQIRAQLYGQISRIQELTDLYKQQKQAKKSKRLEQKKKGKNYKEPRGLKKQAKTEDFTPPQPENQQELKRLYKEAIRHVHPDKFSTEDEEKAAKATALTVQLNSLYDSGDLEELKSFHLHIISGNAMSHEPYQPNSAADPKALLFYLRKKREELAQTLEQTKANELYHVLLTYPDTKVFIQEVRLQFEERIQKLEKRTRKR